MPPRFFYRFFPSDGRPADTDFAARFFVPTGLRNHAPPSFFHCFGDPRFAIMRPIPLLFDERFISVPFHYDFHHPVRFRLRRADTTRHFPGCWNWSRSTRTVTEPGLFLRSMTAPASFDKTTSVPSRMRAPLTGDPEVSRTEPEITNPHPTPRWMGRGPAAAVTFGGPFTTWKSRTQTANAGNIVTQEESPGQSGVDGESGGLRRRD